MEERVFMLRGLAGMPLRLTGGSRNSCANGGRIAEFKGMAIPYAGAHIPDEMVTTGLELPGFRVARNVGIVRGIVVRSRSVVGTFGAGLQTIFGGNITIWAQMCEKARQDSYEIMVRHAQEIGANAIIGARYDANEVSQGVTEVLAYGTAVIVERT